MLTAIIPIVSFSQAAALIQRAQQADLLEFRLDYLSQFELTHIKTLQMQAKKPVIFTVRKIEQGGVYSGDEHTRLALIAALITLKPDYFDIEHDVPLAFCQQLKNHSPTTQLIRSYHNFVDTPNNLSKLLNSFLDPLFSYYKIITTAQSIIDALRVIHFIKAHAQHIPLVAHAMGEAGEISRILGKIYGNCFTYASVEPQEHIAPGLLHLDELINIYHYSRLNAQTKIYGLIGDPVAQSIGHQFHNAAFIEHQQNAVYVKFHVHSVALADFFQGIADLAVHGLSVTMPHKQAVLAFCAQASAAVHIIGAANTLTKHTEGYCADNTDGAAVVQILAPDLKQKKIMVLGAGGAASSIIYSLLTTGAQVSVYNRSPEPLAVLRKKYGIQTFMLNELPQADYDILINTLPKVFYQQAEHLALLARVLQKNKIIMDANYQATPTPLIRLALDHACTCIDGYAMFYAQAQRQRDLWFTADE